MCVFYVAQIQSQELNNFLDTKLLSLESCILERILLKKRSCQIDIFFKHSIMGIFLRNNLINKFN
jgi:hypothetical protein